MLEPLSWDESKNVINRALREAQSKNGVETKIDDEALNLIVHISEGYPHFIQQFGYCAFAHDTDDHITKEDVLQGTFKENGAMDQLARKFFQEMYFDRISSPDYRKVLDLMSNHEDKWVSRKTLIKEGDIKETQVTNALNALKSKNIIFANAEKKGEYRLPTRSFATWIRITAAQRELLNRRPDEGSAEELPLST